MKNSILSFVFIFFIVCTKAQMLKKDSVKEKIANIETVVINDKDYEKVDYSFALKKEINFRLKTGTSKSSFEIGLRFNNNLGQKGRVSNVTLFLHKTEKEYRLTDLEINFYKIDTLTNKPGEKLNIQQIIYTPKNNKRGNVKIDVEKYHIPFPKEGILVSVKWLPNKFNDLNVGPSIRLTNYTERLTYTRYDNDITKWNNGFNFSKKNGLYTNAMIGLEVYIKKEKLAMNKKYLYIIIAFLTLIILCLLTYKTSEKVVFNGSKETMIHDFGTLDKNKTPLYEYTFKYVNTRHDTLKVYGVRDGCDCTESKVKMGLYFKNDTIFIKTKYDPNKYNDNGAIAKQFFLITNKNVSKFDTIFPLSLNGIVK
ncbi:DUF1573 domain-containing protein [Chryseobacterium sp. MMS23-Vi53]|uniref:DUF1573 domain-containing protein n=1 Tax=Chryseobacterium sp. MMS23-Vi53 TaxID=3386644 RepID=UPI0039E9637C